MPSSLLLKRKHRYYHRTGEDNTLPDPLKQYAEIIIADTGTGIDEQEKNISSNVSIRSVTANRIRKAEQE